MSKAFLICALGSALTGLAGARQSAIAADLPPEAVRLQGALLPKVQPAVRAWIDQQARMLTMAGAQSTPDDAAIRSQVRSRFAGQPLPDMDVEALVALVMMEGFAIEEQITKDMLEDMKKMNAAKEKLRALLAAARKQQEQNEGKMRTERCVPPQCGGLQAAARETAAAMREARVDFSLPGRIDELGHPGDLGELRAVVDDLKGKLDAMNDMSQMASLRLQMMMDRRSKMISTLSNIMKNISTTQNTLAQNLK